MTKINKWITLLLCLAFLLALSPVSAQASSPLTPSEVMDGILNNAMEKSGVETLQQWLDTTLSTGAGKGSEWYVISLVERGEQLDYSRFATALQAYVDNEENRPNPTARERIALAFLAVGYHSPYTEYAANCSIGELGLMSYVFGLHLSNNGVNCSHSSQELITAILDLQLEDSGWAITGKKGDPDATAMVLQALAPHQQEESVQKAVDGGLHFLKENQLENGGYRSFGQECPESICQVIVALCSLDIDPLDEDFIKNGITLFDALYAFRMEDGTFRHTIDSDSNNMATMEVLYTLSAYESYLQGGKKLYEFAPPTMDISQAQEKASQPLPSEKPVEEAEKQESNAPKNGNKLWLCVGVGILALGACAYFFFSGRRNAKNFLFVLLAAAGLIYLICTLRIEKTDDYYNAGTAQGETITTTITIRCDTVKNEGGIIPADGIVLDTTSISLSEGATAYDQLVVACKSYRIHLDKEESAFGSAYVKGLANIYELDFGDLSGWMYCVNGKYADVGAGEYKLKAGDVVEWQYTRELGKDLGQVIE